MRYQNWDILLFPTQSRVPVQEFDTKCHVLHSPRAVFAAGPSASDDPFIEKFESLSNVPILTCFIPSLAAGTPFRISVHSWLKPTASTILRSRLSSDEDPAFQARVYVDGVHHSSRTVYAHTTWPEVIETTDVPQHKSTNELLFPAFHPEILQQAHWDAGEQLGRIKIVISEGIMSASSPLTPDKLAFDRLRDIIVFSFQHAPQNVLEYSGIAWPNVRMFENIQRDPRRSGPIGARLPGHYGHDAHAHSPQRSVSIGLGRNTHGVHNHINPGYQTYQPPSQAMTIKPSSSQPNGLVTARALSRDEDPFMGPASAGQQWRSKTRSNSTDDTMPDYVSNGDGHRRTSTEMSVAWPRRDFQRHMDEAAVDEIVQALSPEKRDQLMGALSPMKSSSSGLAPPANTPKTAEGSKQPSPELRGVNRMPSNQVLDLDRLVSRHRYVSDDSAASTSSESERRSSAGSSKREHSELERVIVTRSQRSKASTNIKAFDARPATSQKRSPSDSSKRRKISLSPTTNAKVTPKITLRVSPHTVSSDKENQQLLEDDSEAEGVAITAE